LEQFILWSAVAVFIVALILALRRPPLKDWLLVFFIKGYISITLSVFIVEGELIAYPVRLLAGHFETSVLFELLVFPVLCVYYNQTTYRSGLGGIIGQAVLYSAGMTGIEVWLERNTLLISYLRWSGVSTFIGLFGTFVGVRAIMAVVRHFAGDN